MKLVIDIKDNSAALVMELLKSLDLLSVSGTSKRAGKTTSGNDRNSIGHILLKRKADHAKLTLAEKKAKMAALQSLALKGPVMDEEQYQHYKELRARISLWRQK